MHVRAHAVDVARGRVDAYACAMHVRMRMRGAVVAAMWGEGHVHAGAAHAGVVIPQATGEGASRILSCLCMSLHESACCLASRDHGSPSGCVSWRRRSAPTAVLGTGSL